MKRVVILGLGSSGKTTLGLRLGQITGLRVVELDKIYWRPGLVETPHEEWIKMQHALAADNGWILDGDLGPGDAVESGCRLRTRSFFSTFHLFAAPGALCGDHESVPISGYGYCDIESTAVHF